MDLGQVTLNRPVLGKTYTDSRASTFRLAEATPYSLASEEVKQALEPAGLRGVKRLPHPNITDGW